MTKSVNKRSMSAACSGQTFERLGAGDGRNDAIAIPLQHRARQFAQGRFVFHRNMDSFPPAMWLDTPVGTVGFSGVALAGKYNLKVVP